MSTILNTAEQVRVRQSLSPDRQTMFDVEFSKHKISRTWIVVWYLLFGFIGGHLMYLSYKGSFEHGFGWYSVLLFFGGLLSGNGQLVGVGLLMGFGYFLYLLFSSAIELANDSIAGTVKDQISR